MRLQTNFYDILKRVSRKYNFPKGYIESIGDTMLKVLHDDLAELKSYKIRVYDLGTFEIREKRFLNKYSKIWNDIRFLSGKRVRNKYLTKGELDKWMKIKEMLLHKKLKETNNAQGINIQEN